MGSFIIALLSNTILMKIITAKISYLN